MDKIGGNKIVSSIASNYVSKASELLPDVNNAKEILSNGLKNTYSGLFSTRTEVNSPLMRISEDLIPSGASNYNNVEIRGGYGLARANGTAAIKRMENAIEFNIHVPKGAIKTTLGNIGNVKALELDYSVTLTQEEPKVAMEKTEPNIKIKGVMKKEVIVNKKTGEKKVEETVTEQNYTGKLKRDGERVVFETTNKKNEKIEIVIGKEGNSTYLHTDLLGGSRIVFK